MFFMKERKDIDRLFQENLKDFEVFPSQKMWSVIETKIQKPQKRARFYLWSKSVRVAAVLAVFATIIAIYVMPKANYFSFLKEKNTTKKEMIDKPIVIETNSEEEKSKTEKKEIFVADNDKLINAGGTLEETRISKQKSKDTDLTKQVKSRNKTKLFLNKENEGNNDNHFAISTVFAPIYLNSFTSKETEMFLKEYDVVPELSYAYGVKISYKLSKRISLQSGVNIMNIGYTAKNIYVAPGVATVNFSDLSSSPINRVGVTASTKAVAASSQFNEKGVVNHVFGYVEIPLELKYRIVNGKLGMNLVGGFSTFLLNKNESFVRTNSLYQSLGEMENIRSVNFSGNIGVDIDYLINDNLYINLAPMFKVQTGTFVKNTQGFYPYYLGIYTGINYKF